jgi:hypothetical protein
MVANLVANFILPLFAIFNFENLVYLCQYATVQPSILTSDDERWLHVRPVDDSVLVAAAASLLLRE